MADASRYSHLSPDTAARFLCRNDSGNFSALARNTFYVLSSRLFSPRCMYSAGLRRGRGEGKKFSSYVYLRRLEVLEKDKETRVVWFSLAMGYRFGSTVVPPVYNAASRDSFRHFHFQTNSNRVYDNYVWNHTCAISRGSELLKL